MYPWCRTLIIFNYPMNKRNIVASYLAAVVYKLFGKASET